MLKNKNDFNGMVRLHNIDNEPNPAHREKLRWQMLSVFNKSRQKTLQGESTCKAIRRKIMKSPIAKLAAAVAAITVVATALYYLRTNTSTAESIRVTKPASTITDASNFDLVPLDIKLPKPMFRGTEEPIRVRNLKPLEKSRPPFYVPRGTRNVAFGKAVSSSDEEPIIGELEMITDGDKEAADGSYVELGPFLQHITIDLKDIYEIYAVVVWHYHKQPRAYFDVVVQVADDADFITNVKTLFNNDIDNSAGFGIGKDMHYIDTHKGKLIDAKGVPARYVRFYSNGNNYNGQNHYIEVEVYGRAAK